jgi:hypothetical protein
MPHDRLRFAWIPPPRGARLPRRTVRQERQPNEKGTGNNASPCDHIGSGAPGRLGTAGKIVMQGENSKGRTR